MTDLTAYLMKAPEPYWLHLHKYGIGAHYVAQEMLDNPPPVGSRLVTIPQALARIGRVIEGDAWKDWERNTLHFPLPVLAPAENLADLLVAAAKTAPVKPPHRTILGPQYSPAAYPDDYAERKRAWDEQEPERAAAATATMEQVSQSHQKWKDGVVEHAAGVAALHRAFTALANSFSDGAVQPWFFNPVSGAKDRQRPEWLVRPSAAVDLVRFSRIRNLKGEDCGIALVPVDELDAAFPVAASDAETSVLVDGVTINADDLSPFLRLAIHLAQANKVGSDYRVKKQVLLDAIAQEQEAFGLDQAALGSTAREYLATFIRWPEAKKGRAEA